MHNNSKFSLRELAVGVIRTMPKVKVQPFELGFLALLRLPLQEMVGRITC
jgi:hypothetical protein